MPPTRPRRAAVALALCALVGGLLSVVLLFWVVGQTDNGLMCDPPYDDADTPWACGVYDAPFWLFGLAVCCGVLGVVAFVVSVAREWSSPGR